MTVNPDFCAPCGLYCGVCAIYMAHRDNNLNSRSGWWIFTGEKSRGKGILPNCETLSMEDIKCRGCLSDEQFMHCRQCDIRECTKEKGYIGCHQCAEFPCRILTIFP